MAGFTPDQIDFLMGGLHKVNAVISNVSTIVLNLEDINIQGASVAQGGLMVTPFAPFQSPFAPSLFTVYAASNAGVVKSSVGTIYSLVGTNQSAATARYIQLHNSAAVVASGAVPVRSFQVAAAPGQTAIGSDIFTELGENYPLGVVYAWSTTAQSFTPATGSDHHVVLRLK